MSSSQFKDGFFRRGNILATFMLSGTSPDDKDELINVVISGRSGILISLTRRVGSGSNEHPLDADFITIRGISSSLTGTNSVREWPTLGTWRSHGRFTSGKPARIVNTFDSKNCANPSASSCGQEWVGSLISFFVCAEEFLSSRG